MKKQTFRTCLPRKSSTDKDFISFLGFSVAEAMVTLLIVSIALAAAAPIMSKRINNSSDNSKQINELREKITELEKIIEESAVPAKTIAFFDREDCPPEWEKLTGANGAFIRNIGEDTAKTGITAEREKGTFQTGAAPNITGMVRGVLMAVYAEKQNYNAMSVPGLAYKTKKTTTANNGNELWGEYELKIDASSISSIYKDNIKEIRPDNVAYLACVKK